MRSKSPKRKRSRRERWKMIPDTQGAYEVSNLGRVRRAKPGRGARVGRVLEASLSADGYPRVSIRFDWESRAKHHQVDLLVIKAFRPSALKKFERWDIVHLDGDPTNNKLRNLDVRERPDSGERVFLSESATPAQQRAIRGLLLSGFSDTLISKALSVNRRVVTRQWKTLSGGELSREELRRGYEEFCEGLGVEPD